ncbi:uncharacterized protein LOC112887366 isoform X3 [Panicum hallii]|uniref:uncharacterized protein LOC112887366 isoform X3 n=1 Tax=Panicum hallii TaxID=206008 RepID=UPI000DF4EA0D|nr:uncharacterized protein LOC112887366 isoform X3 [Panicum hallii]
MESSILAAASVARASVPITVLSPLFPSSRPVVLRTDVAGPSPAARAVRCRAAEVSCLPLSPFSCCLGWSALQPLLACSGSTSIRSKSRTPTRRTRTWGRVGARGRRQRAGAGPQRRAGRQRGAGARGAEPAAARGGAGPAAASGGGAAATRGDGSGERGRRRRKDREENAVAFLRSEGKDADEKNRALVVFWIAGEATVEKIKLLLKAFGGILAFLHRESDFNRNQTRTMNIYNKSHG